MYDQDAGTADSFEKSYYSGFLSLLIPYQVEETWQGGSIELVEYRIASSTFLKSQELANAT